MKGDWAWDITEKEKLTLGHISSYSAPSWPKYSVEGTIKPLSSHSQTWFFFSSSPSCETSFSVPSISNNSSETDSREVFPNHRLPPQTFINSGILPENSLLIKPLDAWFAFILFVVLTGEVHYLRMILELPNFPRLKVKLFHYSFIYFYWFFGQWWIFIHVLIKDFLISSFENCLFDMLLI